MSSRLRADVSVPRTLRTRRSNWQETFLEYFIQSFHRVLILRKVIFDNVHCCVASLLELRCKSETIPANDIKLFFNLRAKLLCLEILRFAV